MIIIENEEVYGWEAAIRGMRNPMNSWAKSDSNCTNSVYIGADDLNLMRRLSKAGDDHSKFLRMINVTVDITAPLYWWKEFDTYKIGTVANSCSTMHTITNKEFTIDDFSHEHLVFGDMKTELLDINGKDTNILVSPKSMLKIIIGCLNNYRDKYLETKDKAYWWQIIQLLPSSYNQKRTIQLNYQVLGRMYKARCNHKLDEWRDFCDWIKELPCFEEIVLNRKWTLDTFAEPQ